MIDLLPEQKEVTAEGRLDASRHVADENRRGHAGARTFTASDEIRERHRHRYEFNMKYREQMEAKGFVISGTSPDGTLVELIELQRSSLVSRLPVPPGISVEAEQAAPALQGLRQRLPGARQLSGFRSSNSFSRSIVGHCREAASFG